MLTTVPPTLPTTPPSSPTTLVTPPTTPPVFMGELPPGAGTNPMVLVVSITMTPFLNMTPVNFTMPPGTIKPVILPLGSSCICPMFNCPRISPLGLLSVRIFTYALSLPISLTRSVIFLPSKGPWRSFTFMSSWNNIEASNFLSAVSLPFKGITTSPFIPRVPLCIPESLIFSNPVTLTRYDNWELSLL